MLGDRLFFETRFAQYFFDHHNGNVNDPLTVGDPVVDQVLRDRQLALPGPFRGQSMSCRHCHLGDDFLRTEPLAQRTYGDFTARSAIPHRNDGLTHTARNSPLMVDFGLPREVPRLLHFDGEFANAEDLVVETLVGRNLGWQLGERALAMAHIARVIREDRGTNPRHVKSPEGAGLPYGIVLAGTDPSLPEYLTIPSAFRLDVTRASETEILDAIARLVHAYMDSIRFGTEDTYRKAASPYDHFLAKNELPAKPEDGETNLGYARRLLKLIERRTHFQWIEPSQDGQFELHTQPFRFGELELMGLKIFFSESTDASSRTKSGNCIVCHTPPQFTDHRLHNTGVSQFDYDELFGAGAFAVLEIPSAAERNMKPNEYLPSTVKHPNALDRFRSAPSKEKPRFADLGAWNIVANPDFPKAQRALTTILCNSYDLKLRRCLPEKLLPLSIARFKTPSIRDLGHSDPYFHAGTFVTLEEVLNFYVDASNLARAGRLRNGSFEMNAIRIDASDIALLAAFLRSLNEDYH